MSRFEGADNCMTQISTVLDLPENRRHPARSFIMAVQPKVILSILAIPPWVIHLYPFLQAIVAVASLVVSAQCRQIAMFCIMQNSWQCFNIVCSYQCSSREQSKAGHMQCMKRIWRRHLDTGRTRSVHLKCLCWGNPTLRYSSSARKLKAWLQIADAALCYQMPDIMMRRCRAQKLDEQSTQSYLNLKVHVGHVSHPPSIHTIEPRGREHQIREDEMRKI